MSKISELSDGGSLVSSDYLIAVRSGGNVKVRMDQINVDQVDLGDNEFIRLGNSQDLTMVHTSTQSIINQAGIGDLLIQKAGSTKLTINASGIDVTGSVTADGLTVANTSVIAGDFDGGTAATYIRLQDDTDNFLFGSSNSLGSFVIKNETADAFRMSVANTGDISFYEDTGTTPKFFWDASAEFLGIGTSAPQQVLQISQGASAGTTALRIENTETGIDPAQTANAIEFYTNDASAGGTGVTGKISHVAVNAGTTYALAFSTYNGTTLSESMRIDANGNVGIGTSTLGSVLSIEDTADKAYITQTNSQSAQTLKIGNAYSILGTTLGSYGAIDADAGLLLGTAATERMRIDANGNVGIGTSTPTSFLSGKVTEITNSGITGTAADNQDLIVKSVNRFSAISVIGKNTGGSQLNFGDENNREVGGFQYDHTNDYLVTRVNNAERMRIDSSGNLLVGGTSTNPTGQNVAGAAIDSSGEGNFSVDGAEALRLNRKTSDGTIVSFTKDGATVGSIGTISSNLLIGTGDTGFRFFDGATKGIFPDTTSGAGSDDAIDLGKANARFDDIYATNGTIQTSDRNEKQDIEALSDAEQRVAVAAKGLLRKFRWKDSVEAKGDDARIHFGIIAQDLQAAFEAEGLDAGRYAMFISNTWTDEETGEERTRLGVRYHELLAFIIAAI